MRRPEAASLAVAAALILVGGLTACGDDEGSPETPGVTMTPTIPSPGTGQTDDGQTGGGRTGSGETPDGTAGGGQLVGAHTVSLDVGEIDIDLADGALRLQAVRPAAGWQQRVEDEQSDEIDIDFRHGDGREVDVSFDVEDARDLDVSVDYERGLPEGTQTLALGSIGEVDYEASGTTLTLIEARPGAGWTHTVEDDDDNEVDVDFRSSDGQSVDLRIEIDD